MSQPIPGGIKVHGRLGFGLQPPKTLPPVTPRPFDFHELRQLLGTDAPIILEIGANNGTTTLQLLRYFPGCRIYAVEPDLRALAKFRARINDPRVQLFEMAIGAKDGEAEFYVSSGMRPGVNPTAFSMEYPLGWDQSGSLRKPKTHKQVWPWCTFESKRNVLVRRLDTWTREAGISRVDFIWADIQGAEGDLVSGGKDTLSRTRYFYTEYSNDEWYEGQPQLSVLLEMLETFSILRRFARDVLFKNNAPKV